MSLSNLRRIVIVGAGAVGATFAYALAQSGLVDEIVLIDLERERAEGEVMDLNHGLLFVPSVRIWAGDYADCAEADITVVTAGSAQRPGETRLDLVKRNDAILRTIIPKITDVNPQGIILMVTNPVDVLTYRALQVSGLPYNQVIGSGTVLDTARFRFLLAQFFQIDPRNVHAYIVGEHGDTEVPLWSSADIAGLSIERFCEVRGIAYEQSQMDGLFQQVRNAAYEVIKRKGATYYAIGLSIVNICEAILRDQNSILPISTLLHGEHGVSDICLSLPTIVNRREMKLIPVSMSDLEAEAFRIGAQKLQEVINSLDPI